MRSHGAVYRKLKEVKYRHLVALYRKYLKKTPQNCRYNYQYEIKSKDGKKCSIGLCLLHQPNPEDINQGIHTHLLDVCDCQAHSSQCNAFVPKYTKEQLKNMLEEELKDKNIRGKKYPDICALEWVLEKSAIGIWPLNKIQILYFKIKHILLKKQIL